MGPVRVFTRHTWAINEVVAALTWGTLEWRKEEEEEEKEKDKERDEKEKKEEGQDE